MNMKEQIMAETIKDGFEQIKQHFYSLYSKERIKTIHLEHECKGDYVFFLGWAVLEGSIFNHAYKMLVLNVTGNQLFESHNVICERSYTLSDVKIKAINYFSHYANELKTAINQ